MRRYLVAAGFAGLVALGPAPALAEQTTATVPSAVSQSVVADRQPDVNNDDGGGNAGMWGLLGLLGLLGLGGMAKRKQHTGQYERHTTHR